MKNPFPERGVSKKGIPYYPYWEKDQQAFNQFLNNLKNHNYGQDFSQLLSVIGDLGSGKTATIFYIEEKLKKELGDKILVLKWQNSMISYDHNLIQSFYKDFLSQFHRILMNNFNDASFLVSVLDVNIKEIIESIESDKLLRLIDMLKEYSNLNLAIEKENIELKEKLNEKLNGISKFLQNTVGKKFNSREIGLIERYLLKDENILWNFNINIGSNEITENMQKILRALNKKHNYNSIVLLVDEFDILIRHSKVDTPQINLNLLRDFIKWFSLENLKGFHCVISLFSENFKILYKDQNGNLIESIHRRLLNKIVLRPIQNFEDFHELIYSRYLENEKIDLKFTLFDNDYLRFIFHACKRNFGTIFSILHEQFTSWQEDINNSYHLFLKDPTKTISGVSLFDLIWRGQGLSRYFSKYFLEIVSKKDEKKRKLIFIYLLNKKEWTQEYPTYDSIRENLSLNTKDLVIEFHRDLAELQVLNEIFPLGDDNFFINFKYIFRLLNLYKI